jgi:eukaryotic-like serine/threonine-protein kinase
VIGQTLGHYRVVAKIGAGGMGEVYRAHDEQLARDVALKVLPAGMLADDAVRKQFRKEALALGRLNHPNIETVFEFGSQEGVDFLAMELIGGSSLRERLKEGPLAEQEIQRLGIQLAEGLAAAHEQGIIHRDLKPGNLFVTPEGHLKILDFGLAKIFHPELGTDVTQSIATDSSTISGTVPYMSPEQLRGLPVDVRSDIYAAGAVLYEMATGQRPFPHTQSAELMGAILHQTPSPPSSVNPHVSPGLESAICKTLEKEPQRRYQSARELLAALETGATSAATPHATHSRWPWAAAAALTIVGLALGGWLYYARHAHAVAEKDTIILADFANTTGDPVFDDALRQALAADLAQSPFLNLLSDNQMRQTLRLMGRQPSEKLTPEVAQDLCQRAGSKAYLAGSIAALGTSYAVGLEAVNCQTGEALARQQARAGSKEEVLNALDQAATKLRGELGESLVSIKKYDVPLYQVTTSSLEALKAYCMGTKATNEQGFSADIPYQKRAIDLDSNFAMAYVALGQDYANLGETRLAHEYLTRAYELRERTSEREKLQIAANYYLYVTGNLEQANQTLELQRQRYPRYADPYVTLGYNYALVGQYEKAAAMTREALNLNPNNVSNYANLAAMDLLHGRLEEAKTMIDQALSRKFDDTGFHQIFYALALLKGDAKAMAEQSAWGKGQPAEEDLMLSLQADTEAQSGHLGRARELSERATETAQRQHLPEEAAAWEAEAALREAVAGNARLAKSAAQAALQISSGRDTKAMVALARAIARDKAAAEKLAKELEKEYPADTLVNGYWLPAIRAALALEGKKPVDAVEALRPAEANELGLVVAYVDYACLYPVYLRGKAYLAQGQGAAAATEFQKYLDHRTVAWNCPLVPLAHLGLARAYALQGDTAKAHATYQDFLTLWKDADPDIPILVAAKSEYAKLK